MTGIEFDARLFTIQAKGGWTFAPVPDSEAPDLAGPWGRTPCRATVDGQTWETSVWRSKEGETVLAVPARIRRGKGHGDLVRVRLEPLG